MSQHSFGKMTVCNQRRIDEFLQSQDYRLEDRGLIAHLDECESCRSYIEERSSNTEIRTTATEMLQPNEFDNAGSIACSAASNARRVGVPSAIIQDALELLSPTDYPHHLGRLGAYEITGIVGVGAMGVVFKAIDPSLDRVVALKIMAPRLANNGVARMRFLREAKAAAAILHANVIPIHSVASDGSLPYLVMSYIRGGSLQKRLKKNGPLPLHDILRIGSQIAAGLQAAHEKGLVHRDIKPENVLLGEGVERVTITDFGLARAVDDNTVTQQGTIAGTPMYMSPEQARGEKVDQQSDLFSLGSVLYASCTGRPPFQAETSFGVMRRIIDESPVPIRKLAPETPVWFANIVERLMAREKSDRFASAAEVHELLDICLSHVEQPDVTNLPNLVWLGNEKPETILSSFKSKVFAMFVLTAMVLLGLTMLPLGKPQDGKNGEIQLSSSLSGSDQDEDQENEVRDQELREKADSFPTTWKELGMNFDDDYPANEISLIHLLNQSRGVWSVAGGTSAKGKESEFTGELRIAGGFKEQLDNGHMPGWSFALKGNQHDNEFSVSGQFMAFPEKEGVQLKLVRITTFGGKQIFDANWDAKDRTLTLIEAELPDYLKKIPAKRAKTVSEAKRSMAEFTIAFGKDNSIRLKEIVETTKGNKITIQAQTTFRKKTSLVDFSPPKADPTHLPNGFAVFVASRSQISLNDESDEIVVGSNVSQIGSNGDLIYGKVEKSHDSNQETVGYFVLNSGKGERDLKKGLSEIEWVNELKKRKLAKPPVLVDSEHKRPRADWGRK